MSSKIVNSAAGNDYFNLAGTAVSDTVQPKVDGGSVGGLSTSQMPEGDYIGHVPVTEDIEAVAYSGVETSQVSADNVDPVITQNNIKEVYKVRDYLVKTAFRENKFNSIDNTFDAGYPATGESTSELQVSNATNPTLNDHGLLNQEVVYGYSIKVPIEKQL